ncbi:MAG: hypothetical protein ACOC0F_00150 [archaeon]
MRIRDAVEADAGAMAAIADAPADVMRHLVHDRSVRIADDPDAGSDPNVDAQGDDPSENVLGFVSFDARDDVVYVTQLDGTPEAVETLLAEPVRFAKREGMNVELLAPDSHPHVEAAAETVGFAKAGNGPRFDGTPTIRYRLEP